MSSLVCYDSSSSSDDEDITSNTNLKTDELSILDSKTPDTNNDDSDIQMLSVSDNVEDLENNRRCVLNEYRQQDITSNTNLKTDELYILDSNTPDTNNDNSEIQTLGVSDNVEDLENNRRGVLNEYRQQEIINISVDEDTDTSSSSSSDCDDLNLTISSTDSDDSSDLEVLTKTKNLSNTVEISTGRICSYCIGLNNKSSNINNDECIDKELHKELVNVNTTNIDNGCNIINDIESNKCESTSNEINRNDNIVGSANSSDVTGIEDNCSIMIEDGNSIEGTLTVTNSNENAVNSCTCGRNANGGVVNGKSTESKKVQKNKKKLYYDEIDLPPIEDLHISVEEEEAKPIGTILHFVQNSVLVSSYCGIPSIDFDSVLFLDKGKRTLGRVEDVIGDIYKPYYLVRFNSVDHIKEKKIEKDDIVYYAPQTEHTSFVILDKLVSSKGSDASWKDDREPPEQFLEYSDDEEERIAKATLKAKRKGKGDPTIIAIEPFDGQRKILKRNPFSRNPINRPSFSRTPRFATPLHCNGNAFNPDNKRQVFDPQRSNVRFGCPPSLREGSRSPFPSFSTMGSSFNNNSRRPWSGNPVASSSGFHSRSFEQNNFVPDFNRSSTRHGFTGTQAIFNAPTPPPPLMHNRSVFTPPPIHNSFTSPPPQIYNTPVRTPPPPIHHSFASQPPPQLYDAQIRPSHPPPQDQPMYIQPNIQHPPGQMPPSLQNLSSLYMSPNIRSSSPFPPNMHNPPPRMISNVLSSPQHLPHNIQSPPPPHHMLSNPSRPPFIPPHNQDPYQHPPHIPSNSSPPPFIHPSDY